MTFSSRNDQIHLLTETAGLFCKNLDQIGLAIDVGCIVARVVPIFARIVLIFKSHFGKYLGC